MHFSTLTTFTSLALLALHFVPSTLADNNPDDPNGKSFYVTQPACNYYQCQVKTQPGGVLPVEWIHPKSGNVDIFFNPDDGQKGLKTYKIAKNIPANNDESKCGGKSCGIFEWNVPKNIKPGNYSVEIHSLAHKKLYGYSDIVTVEAGKKGETKNSTVASRTSNSTKKGKHHHHKNSTLTEAQVVSQHHKHHSKNATTEADKKSTKQHHHNKHLKGHSKGHKHNKTTKAEKKADVPKVERRTLLS